MCLGYEGSKQTLNTKELSEAPLLHTLWAAERENIKYTITEARAKMVFFCESGRLLTITGCIPRRSDTGSTCSSIMDDMIKAHSEIKSVETKVKHKEKACRKHSPPGG